MSQGCALLILRSKGQRSRSWRMVIWKWFPDDNWLCNQPMIMKLHTLTPHESRMCPIDFGVKRSTVKVMAHGYLKMVHRNNGCRFEFVGVGGGPVLLQQYFQYAFICCPSCWFWRSRSLANVGVLRGALLCVYILVMGMVLDLHFHMSNFISIQKLNIIPV